MKITVEAAALGKALGEIQGIIGRQAHSTLPILSNALIEARDKSALRVTATDLDISLRTEAPCQVVEQGAITLSVGILRELISTLAGDETVELEATDQGRAKLRAGSVSCELLCIEVAEFPEVPKHNGKEMIELEPGFLEGLIRKTAFATSTDETRYNLNGVLLQVPEDGMIRMVATDGHRLAVMEQPTEIEGTEALKAGVIIPTKGVRGIAKLLRGEEETAALLKVDGNNIFVKHGKSLLIARLIDGTYPDYQQVIPKHDRGPRLPREELIQAVKRVVIVASKKERSVAIEFKGEAARLSAEDPEVGNATQEIKISHADTARVRINGRYLLDVLDALDGDEVDLALGQDLDPVVVTSEGDPGYTHVLMPQRF